MIRNKLQNYFGIKRILPRAIWQPAKALAIGLVTPIRFSRNTGHWKSSLRMLACSANGTPIPWYTYPAIDFLSNRNFKGKRVLEFGGGQSTLWWSARAQSVLTIEEDADWYERLRPQIGSNVTLHHVSVDRTARTIKPIKDVIDASPMRLFDVIVVDGLLRRELTALAFSYLAPCGALLLDDSQVYGFDETKDRDCRRIDFFGFAPAVPSRRCTSLVFIGDCFLLQPGISIPVMEEIAWVT